MSLPVHLSMKQQLNMVTTVNKANGIPDLFRVYIPELSMSFRSALSRCHNVEPKFLDTLKCAGIVLTNTRNV